MLNNNQEEVVQEIQRLIAKYNTWATQVQATTVCLTILSIMCSIFTGFFAGEISPLYIKLSAGIAALSTSLLASLRLSKKSQDLRNAYRYLQYALYQFKIDPEYGIVKLVRAFQNAERIVGNIELDDAPTLTEHIKSSVAKH